jgi:hypothetical protein
MVEPVKTKLKVGLLLDSFHVPAWVAKVIDDILNCEYAEITLIILNETTKDEKPSGKIHATCDNRGSWLWRLYNRFDDRTFKTDSDPFAPVNIADKLRQVPVISINPLKKKYSDYFPDEKISEILNHELDVVFRFGFRIIRGKALEIAKYGVWGFHNGDSRFYRGGPPAFWELMNGELVIGSELQILTSRLNAGRVIYRSWSKATWFSMKETRCNCFWKTTNFAVRKLRDLYELGEIALKDVSNGVEYCAYSAPLYRLPTNKRLLYYMNVQLANMIRQVLSKLFYKFQWFLAYKISDTEPGYDGFYDYDYIVPPNDRTWADPFVIHHDGKYYIFVEEYPFSVGKGHISVLEVDGKGKWKQPVKVLDRPYHLSYPHVFKYRSEWYMTPESMGNKTVELYKSVRFPFEWQFEKSLLENVRAVDATIHEHDGKLWMFVNISDEKTSLSEELHLYYADSLHGPWIPHKRNPVKTDVRSTRPAGRMFYWNNELYRLSQDCSLRYGYAITICRIIKLTEDEFKEEEVSKILPKWKKNMIGNHMLNRDGRLTVIDAYRRLRRF